MAVDKLVDSTQLDNNLTSIANAIRSKTGGSAQLSFPTGMVNAINDIPTSTPTQTKTMALGSSAPAAVTPDSGYALSQVSPSIDSTIIKSDNIKSGVSILGVTGTYSGDLPSKGMVATAWDSNGNPTAYKLYGMTTVPYRAFQTNQYITTVDFNGATTIDSYAFINCPSFAMTALPEGITSLGSAPFQNCTALTTMTLPSTLNVFGDDEIGHTFAGCTSLTTVRFKSTPSQFRDQYSAFNGCTALTDIYVPWAEGAISGAPWGAPNSPTIHYNSTT